LRFEKMRLKFFMALVAYQNQIRFTKNLDNWKYLFLLWKHWLYRNLNISFLTHPYLGVIGDHTGEGLTSSFLIFNKFLFYLHQQKCFWFVFQASIDIRIK
jgi:hypothetical protein